MPSIRIRDSTYSTLGDTPVDDGRTAPEAHSLANIFRRSVSPSPRDASVRRRPSQLQTLPETDHDAFQPLTASDVAPSTQSRRSSRNSRILAHCLQSSVHSSSYSSRSVMRHSLPPSATSLLGLPLDPDTSNVDGNEAAVHISSERYSARLQRSMSFDSLDIPQETLQEDPDLHHCDEIVEHLDVIDHQIGAVSALTNAANAIVIPPVAWPRRKPVIDLFATSRETDAENPTQYEDPLDRHVEDVLERPSKFHRTLMGIWSFLKTPMGIFVGIYGFLVAFWGAAIVLFLAKIINLHNPDSQGFWVEISSQVETGLFTITGVGLIPSRVLDTYRVVKIWKYKRKTMKLRAKANLPQLLDVDDLPDPAFGPNYVHVLTNEEQGDLSRQQRKFHHHQTWYRAHGTETHRAFPINLALWICLLNDGNSIFQVMLCGTMWGLNRFQRPAWTTGTLIPASFLCGIGAAILIWRGGERTKRVEKVKARLRAALEKGQVEYLNVIRSSTTVPLYLSHPSTQDSSPDIATSATTSH